MTVVSRTGRTPQEDSLIRVVEHTGDITSIETQRRTLITYSPRLKHTGDSPHTGPRKQDIPLIMYYYY